MYLAKNLKILLDEQQLSPSELSERCGVDKSQLSRILSGKTTNPQVETLRPIAEFFGITIDQLIDSPILPVDESYGTVVSIKRRLLPVIEWEEIPHWIHLRGKLRIKETVHAKKETSSEAFAFKVKDERFWPTLSQGTIVVIEPQKEPEDQDYILMQATEQKIVLTQLLLHKEKLFLKSIGKEFTITPLCAYYKRLGVVVEGHLNF